MKIYTRRGDDGTTTLRGGLRVAKDDRVIDLLGTIDEAQAALGVARAESGPDLGALLVKIERDLWIVMAEVATPKERATVLEPGVTSISQAMIDALETEVDRAEAGLDLESSFSVPGANRLSASLDLARTVVRRAERMAIGVGLSGGPAARYLNRLSDLCWMLARANEDEHLVNSRREHGGRTSDKGAR